MKMSFSALRAAFIIAFLFTMEAQFTPPARSDDDVVQSVINLISDKDKDVRAIGLEQVRGEVKGPQATRRFAALLPKLAPEAEVGLLDALAERGDAAARPAVLDLVEHSDGGEVRGAAIRALGAVGTTDDVPRLARLLGDAKSAKDAIAAITGLRGEGINAALCAEIKSLAPPQRVALLQLLVVRRAIDSVPTLLDAAKDADAHVRVAALDALGQLAGPELVAKLARLILDAKDAAARGEAEKALMLIARRNPEVDQRALPLLAVMAGLNEKEKTGLLSALGRIGGKPARRVIEAALAENDPGRSAAALRGLCNWPDGSIAPQLVALALAAKDPAVRKMVVEALIRVAPLPDKRPDAQRLAMLKKAMELASSDEQRALVLKRSSAICSVETLRFVAPYMDQPKFTQVACQAVVELAHHKEVRQPNRAEFNQALDKVIALSKDPEALLRARHYQKDETWVEKQIKGK